MSFTGHVQNGQVVLDEPLPFEDGAIVEIAVVTPIPSATKPVEQLTHFERYRDFIGSIPDLPSDMAEQHDHYIHGTPKK